MALTKAQIEELGYEFYESPEVRNSAGGIITNPLEYSAVDPSKGIVQRLDSSTAAYLKSIGITPTLNDRSSTGPLSKYNTSGGNTVTLQSLEGAYGQIAVRQQQQQEEQRVQLGNAAIKAGNIADVEKYFHGYTLWNGAFVQKTQIPQLEKEGATVSGGNVVGPSVAGLGGVPMSPEQKAAVAPGAPGQPTSPKPVLSRVPTGSIGPDGKPIYDVFDGSEHIKDPNDPRLNGVNIFNLPLGRAPEGFKSQFQPVTGEQNVKPDPQAQISAIDNQINAETESDLQKIIGEFGEKIDTSRSSSLVESISKLLEGEKDAPPPPPSAEQRFNKLMAENGVEPLQGELNRLQGEIAKVESALIVEARRTDDKLVSTSEIGRRKSQLQRRAEEEILLLRQEENSIQRQLTNKLSTVQMLMDFQQSDIDTANQRYTQEFSRNLSLIQLAQGIESNQQDRISEIRDTARADLQIIMNSVSEGAIDFNSLSNLQKVQIQQLELASGLPIGFTAQIKATIPDDKILSTTTRESGGAKYADIVSRGADGKINVTSIPLGSSSGDGSISSDIDSYAQRLNAGQIDPSNVPQDIRGQVLTRAKSFAEVDLAEDI